MSRMRTSFGIHYWYVRSALSDQQNRQVTFFVERLIQASQTWQLVSALSLSIFNLLNWRWYIRVVVIMWKWCWWLFTLPDGLCRFHHCYYWNSISRTWWSHRHSSNNKQHFFLMMCVCFWETKVATGRGRTLKVDCFLRCPKWFFLNSWNWVVCCKVATGPSLLDTA